MKAPLHERVNGLLRHMSPDLPEQCPSCNLVAEVKALEDDNERLYGERLQMKQEIEGLNQYSTWQDRAARDAVAQESDRAEYWRERYFEDQH